MDTQRKLGSTNSCTMIAVLVLIGLFNSAFATLYTVGGNAGWIELSQGATSYDDQFTGITLVVGDQLSFPYTQGAHNVYQVNPTQLADCDGTSPIATHAEGDTIITLDTAGYWGFICEIGNHCSQGAMHLAVNVSAASAPTPAPSTAPIQAPVATPVRAPVSAPARSPVATPVQAPVAAPTSQTPTSTPSRAPTPTPTPTPSITPAPSVSPASASSPSIESGLSPSESLPAKGPDSGAHSLVTKTYAIFLSSAAACLAILVL